MNKSRLLLILVIFSLIQLLVPVLMIAKREHTLRHGAVVKFRTAPVDPYDAFRGRYVALNFESRSVALEERGDFQTGQKVHAAISTDSEGFGYFSAITRERPAEGLYLSTRINHISDTNVFLRLPFDRFYMDESEAPAAEHAYWRHANRTNHNAYVQVRIKDGFGVIEDLYVANTPIREYIARSPRED